MIWVQAMQYILENNTLNKNNLLNIALSFYPLGALTAPVISSFIASRGFSWKYIYYLIIIIIITIIILYLTLKNVEIKKEKFNQKEKYIFRNVFDERNNNIIFILICLLIIFYSIAQTVFTTWSPTFFRIKEILNTQASGMIISIFWIFVIVGRIIVVILTKSFKIINIMIILSTIACMSLAFIFFSNIHLVIYLFASIAGLGFSGIYPLLISTGTDIYIKKNGLPSTILFVSSSLGILIAPFLTSFFSKYSLDFSISLALIFMFITVLFLVLLNILKKSFKITII